MKTKPFLCTALLFAVLVFASGCNNTTTNTEKANPLEDFTKSKDTTFQISDIPNDVFARMQGKSYPDHCRVPREDLKYLQISYVDFNGETQLGEMVVNKVIAEDVLDIFKQLYEASYPIEKMKLIDEYDAIDEKSMTDNNTSAFCFRYINNSTNFSNHAKGMAVDINPLYNPYVKGDHVEPEVAQVYLDRTKDMPYYLKEEDLAVKLFKEKGFIWGGNYSGLSDYQHFEMENELYKDLMS